MCFYSLVTKKGAVCTLFPLSPKLWLCSQDRTVFGQLPAWHHPLPAVFSGCWPAPIQVYYGSNTLDGGGGPSGSSGALLLCNMVRSGDWHPSLKLYSHGCFSQDFLLNFLTSMTSLYLSHSNKPKSTQSWLKFHVILSYLDLVLMNTWFGPLSLSPNPFSEPQTKQTLLHFN